MLWACVLMQQCTNYHNHSNYVCVYVIMELGSIVGSTVHLIKKLTFYARRTCMGMGVLHATDRRATSTNTGVASAILSN